MKNYDLIVIGGGSGGVRAARIAANHGASVALIEEYRLGGTCVIRGCVPKKLMVYASRFAHDFEDAKGYGWTFEHPQFNWSHLKSKRDQEVSRLEDIYRKNLIAAGVTIFEGHASLIDSKTILLTNSQDSSSHDSSSHDSTSQGSSSQGSSSQNSSSQDSSNQDSSSSLTLSGSHVLIATGGIPASHDAYPGIEHTIDSNGFFDLEQLPKKVVIHGAGYIALEFACIFKLLGSSVDIIVRGDNILRGFDSDIQDQLKKELIALGISFHFKNNIQSVQKLDTQLSVTLNDHSILEADCVLRAVGRIPNTQGLGLEKVGIVLDSKGAITVNDYSQTNIESVYAVGDVTNRVNLTPMAIREGHAFADTVFGKHPRLVNHDLVPTAVFTTPEVGVVGLTEEQALIRYPQLDIYLSHFRPMKATLSGAKDKVLFKLLVDRATDKVLGFHSIGHDTGEMIQLLGVALQMKVTKKDLDATLAVHPTAAEEWVTFRAPTKQHNLSI